jgi:hypothetical protein
MFALVDDEDYEWLSQWKWFASKPSAQQGFYAFRKTRVHPPRKDTRQTTVGMHREIVKLQPGDERFVDHVNSDTLDNRKCNLRVATRGQNAANQRLSRKNTSGFKGVTPVGNKWQAQIGISGRRIYLGLFNTPELAHAAYCAAAARHFGEFARSA